MAKPLISARTLRTLRTLAARTRQDTCTILRPAERVPDGGGAFTDVPAQQIGPLPCRLSATGRGGRVETADLIKLRGSYTLHLPLDTDVRRTDQIRVGTRTYRIVYLAPITALSVDLKVGLEDS